MERWDLTLIKLVHLYLSLQLCLPLPRLPLPLRNCVGVALRELSPATLPVPTLPVSSWKQNKYWVFRSCVLFVTTVGHFAGVHQ